MPQDVSELYPFHYILCLKLQVNCYNCYKLIGFQLCIYFVKQMHFIFAECVFKCFLWAAVGLKDKQ